MSKLGVLVKMDVLPGRLEGLIEPFKEYHQLVLQEPGLECRHVMRENDEPSRVIIFEIWESQQDFENHLASEHCKKFVEVIRGAYSPDGFIKTLTPLA